MAWYFRKIALHLPFTQRIVFRIVGILLRLLDDSNILMRCSVCIVYSKCDTKCYVGFSGVDIYMGGCVTVYDMEAHRAGL